MKTPAKLGLGLLAVVVAGLIFASVFLMQNLDSIVKGLIEDTGSDVIGTNVRLSEVKLILTDGRAELHGLRIANPSGFDADNAFEMDQVAVQIDPASLTGAVIVIDEVLVDGAVLNIEQQGSKTNIKQLLDNMASQAGEPPPASEPAENQILLAVTKFSFINSSATLSAPVIDDSSLEIPPIRLTNLGTAEQGLTPAQLTQRMTRQLLQQVEKAVSARLEELAKDAAKQELEKQLDSNLSDADKAKVDGLKSLLKK